MVFLRFAQRDYGLSAAGSPLPAMNLAEVYRDICNKANVLIASPVLLV